MTAGDAGLVVSTAAGMRQVRLSSYRDAAADEQAAAAAYTWIKALRHARVDGEPMRRRFTLRGDSLWWFAEVYLHKQQVILSIFRLLAGLERLAGELRPAAIRVADGDHVARVVVAAFARAHGIAFHGSDGGSAGHVRLAQLDVRARALTLAARASRLRPPRRPAVHTPAAVAAFVHRAFWRQGSPDAEAEAYIGPVLSALEERSPAGSVRYVGVGPVSNFGARRWWHALGSQQPAGGVVPVEAWAPLPALRQSHGVWRDRYRWLRMLWDSDDIREQSVIAGCDVWPIVREELAGIAWLQWPWSARAMDEAAGALDALKPGAVVTYAEAGGWGRAIVLEARRRRIPSVGLQHGFIYRHWLNYRHEPDEMTPDPAAPGDAGFPFPTRTLLFDRYASEHLETAGSFPPGALDVTGSARLDALVTAAGALAPGDIAAARESAGASSARPLVLVVTKFREARQVLGPLFAAAAALPEVQVAVKTHPAETPDAYAPLAEAHGNVRILPASAPLGPLLAASRAIVTVNSTVALDAAVLGVPSLVIGLPNNLSPFVDAGVFAGAADTAAIETELRRILYDERFRQQLGSARDAFLARFAIGADGGAAGRAAAAILALARPDDVKDGG